MMGEGIKCKKQEIFNNDTLPTPQKKNKEGFPELHMSYKQMTI